MRGATRHIDPKVLTYQISIHAPHARSDPPALRVQRGQEQISIHAPHARSDHPGRHRSRIRNNFNPRSSCEERQQGCDITGIVFLFQSTLLMRGATSPTLSAPRFLAISIHAPHARSDWIRIDERRSGHDFNPRSSCEERPSRTRSRTSKPLHFNPRSSCEERRPNGFLGETKPENFNPRSSCEERPGVGSGTGSAGNISIHAPHARSDRSSLTSACIVIEFQSTLLMRGATSSALRYRTVP